MTYYVDQYGSNTSGDGSQIAPWATLSYAISRVLIYGDIIHINAGTYPAISTQMLLANGVTIEGASRSLVTIFLTYSSGTPCIKLETWNGWENKSTVGHQSISGIKFVGSTTPGTPIAQACIGVNFRNSVEIYDCEFVDFRYSAAWFCGEPTYNNWTIDNPYETRVGEDSAYLPFSDSFCTGNKFYNNVVSNCCGLISGSMYSGELQVATQDGMLIYGNTMTALGRAARGNGVPIKLIHDVGFNRNVKIYSNNINAGHLDTNYWQFAMEIWWDLGGLEIYDNVINGSIDLCHQWDQYSAGFGAKVYDNDIGYPTTTTNLDYGIRLEDQHIDCHIFRNKIHHVAIGIEVNNANRNGAEVWDGVYIYDNLIVDLSGRAYQTWGILQQSGVVNHAAVWRNCYIQHNTIIASASAPSPTYYGIMLPTVEDFDGLYIENNILINWERGAIYGSGTRVQATNFYIRNNLIYDSYNSNNPVYVNSYPTAGITYVAGPKADPLFIGGSPYDYHLVSTTPPSSPAYRAGRAVNIILDHDERLFYIASPTIGAYEYADIKKTTTINIVGGSPVHLMAKPSWITVQNNADDSILNVGDLITDGMVLAISPNAENLGGYRQGFIILNDSLPNPDELMIRVVQDANPNAPTVSVNLDSDPSNILTLLVNGPNTTAPDWMYLDINFTPFIEAFGSGVYLNIYYSFTKNGVNAGSGSWSANNNVPFSTQLLLLTPVITTDTYEVTIWST